ncbi:Cysteine-rich receptor-like protein kinase 25 [Camellia lanceoleosa]|uniref:Cysteine-rich receptor-like protein kinase 25 n=1 Tax=Camellia lanceoleosa TaxID=1840588 RepID=A0ACC0GDT5_9ERIC|nr:Cysteine-rich receptor-like protein kinase 25 [Camellia lanceoleosa]
MYHLASEAGKGPMMYYAHDELPATAGDVAPKSVSAMMQCSKDISGDECANNCLRNLIKYAETCCLEKSGWRILAPSCNVRYEEYHFLTPSMPPPVPPPVPPPMPPRVPPPVPPPAPTTTSKGKVVLLIIVPVSTFLVVAFGFYFYRLFGRRSKAREVLEGMSQEILLNNMESQTRKRFMVKGLEVQDEDESRDMHYFNLTTLQIATNNFSDANKLGQGGFGPVYKVENIFAQH